jgi:hypothetical protein
MNLRSDLLDWLAALPSMGTAEERRLLLARTGPTSLYLWLVWDGSSYIFAERLLGALARGGKAAVTAFLESLARLPWLSDNARGQEELAALRSRLEALDEAQFRAACPPEDLALALQESAPDPGILAAALAGDVLLPYYVLGPSQLEQEAGEPAALLAGQVARLLEATLSSEPEAAALLDDLRNHPGPEHPESLAALADLLVRNPVLARDLAALLAWGLQPPGEDGLRSLLELGQRLVARSGETFEAAAEGPPHEGLEYSLPETGDDRPGEEQGPPVVPKAPAPAAPPSPPRVFESIPGPKPEEAGTRQDVGTVGSGGTVTGTVVGSREPVTSRGQQHHGDRIDTGGGSYVGGNAQVGRDLIGRDQVVHGDQVSGPKYEAGTIVIYHGAPDSALAGSPSGPTSPLIEEAIRLDVAAPPAATLHLPFDLAVAVRQPDAPTLAVEDLSQVQSQDGTVFRREEDEIVHYRVAVAAAGCDVQPPHYILKLRPRTNSATCWFQLTPHRPGRQSIFVTAYQQDDALAAQTRLSIEVQVPVSPGD